MPVTKRIGQLTRTEEAILGFDARYQPAEIVQFWTNQRRREYLLNDEVAHPVSVDPMVWPSLFGEGLSDDDRREASLTGIAPPPWRGPNQHLWDDLHRMWSTLTPMARQTAVLVAVTWVSTDQFRERSLVGAPRIQEMMPSALGAEWDLLGFDVADAYLTSGLANCGYSAPDRERLRLEWGGRLNERHLFAEYDDAAEFAAVTARRVPEHAPFFVFALRIAQGPKVKVLTERRGP